MEIDRPTIAVVVAPGNGMPPGLDPLRDEATLELVDDAARLAETLPRADVLAVYDFRTKLLAGADWSNAEDVRWIHAASAGVDAVMVPAVREREIPVTNARGVFDRAIAEYVLGTMLVVAKDMHTSLRLQAERRWKHRDTALLAGKRLLVAGAGSIGTEVARVATAIGLGVEGIARSARDESPYEHVYAAGDLLERLPHADFVAITAPLTEETRGMFGAAAFATMPSTAWLINVGRGPIVDQEALVAALRAGEIAGAALDVFEEEPLPPGHPLWSMENVIVSPHMSGDFHGWVEHLSAQFVALYRHWFAGESMAARAVPIPAVRA